MKKKILWCIFLLAVSVYIPVNAVTLDCSITLKNGSTGNNVKILQRVLNEKAGCGLTVDGSFGKLTKSCVIAYQKEHNLVQDGIVGPKTCSMLNGTSEVIKEYKKTNTTKVIVIVSEANIRKSATTNSSILRVVSLGSEMSVVSLKNNWYKVRINGEYGYIRSDLVAKDSIVVDISEQTLYVYQNGQLAWSTKVVTGNKGNHDTPIGSYVLRKNNLETSRYLRGTNDNGTKYSSYVDYWMPFIMERGIGFHDASWRTADEFTTSTYQGHGSHGCVNMQQEAAKKLYESITSDINVVIRD